MLCNPRASGIQSNNGGQSARIEDADLFLPAAFSPDDTDVLLRHAEFVCQEFYQMCIGFAVDGRCTDAQLDLLTHDVAESVLAAARLHAAVEDQAVILPEIPGWFMCIQSPGTKFGLTPLANGATSKILRICRARNTKIGDRSRPPIEGSRRRNGAMTGSVSWRTSTNAGWSL